MCAQTGNLAQRDTASITSYLSRFHFAMVLAVLLCYCCVALIELKVVFCKDLNIVTDMILILFSYYVNVTNYIFCD